MARDKRTNDVVSDPAGPPEGHPDYPFVGYHDRKQQGKEEAQHGSRRKPHYTTEYETQKPATLYKNEGSLPGSVELKAGETVKVRHLQFDRSSPVQVFKDGEWYLADTANMRKTRTSGAQRQVVFGAALWCDKGSMTTPLVALRAPSVHVCGCTPATTHDFLPLANILPFGTCQVTGGPCIPITLEPWKGSVSGRHIGDDPALTEHAWLDCKLGGQITIADPKQYRLVVEGPQSSGTKPDPWTPGPWTDFGSPVYQIGTGKNGEPIEAKGWPSGFYAGTLDEGTKVAVHYEEVKPGKTKNVRWAVGTVQNGPMKGKRIAYVRRETPK